MTNFEYFKKNLTLFDLMQMTSRMRCINCPASGLCETINNSCDETFRIWAVQEHKEENNND